MKNKILIMWELTLDCNLSCNFCLSGERRKLTTGKISFDDAKKIIDNLPKNSHISFIGGENFLFPKFIDVLKYLEEKGMTFEITTNGSIISNYVDEINSLKNLTNIFFSIDSYGENHNKIRGYKGLYEKIIKIIPKIKTKINVNSVILPEAKDEEIIKLFLHLSKININMYRISYYMNFQGEDIKKSKLKIKELDIKTKFKEKVNNERLKIKILNLFKKLLKIKSEYKIQTKLDLHPMYLLKKDTPKKCRSIENYFRVNEYGKLTICHFISNDFSNLINIKFEEAIKQDNFCNLKKQIQNNFPLDICKNCGKGV